MNVILSPISPFLAWRLEQVSAGKKASLVKQDRCVDKSLGATTRLMSGVLNLCLPLFIEGARGLTTVKLLPVSAPTLSVTVYFISIPIFAYDELVLVCRYPLYSFPSIRVTQMTK